MSAKDRLKEKAVYFIEKYADGWVQGMAKSKAFDKIDNLTEYEAAQDLAKLRE